MRVSIRARTTAAFAGVMLVLLAGIAILTYRRMSSALLDDIDTELRYRAVATLESLPTAHELIPDPRLQEPNEAFEQVLSSDGAVLSATRDFAAPLLTPHEVAKISGATFLNRAVAGVVGIARLLAVPAREQGRRIVVVIGATMSDRRDALRQLNIVLWIGGPAAVAVACLAAWLVAGAVLRPMERLRAQAAAITASGMDRRLSVPRTRDEVHRLAVTLNEMLDRLAGSMAGERAFLARAGHELRTPLAALRAEIDVALHRPRSAQELAAALRSVSEETDRLARLADDLLVLARASDGRLPLRREPVDLPNLLGSAATRFAAQAREHDVTIRVTDAAGTVDADALRLRQVLTNLIANAVRHSPPGGCVTLAADVVDGHARISVADEGPGFNLETVSGTGLGLQIVRAIVAAHGGDVAVRSAEAHGASVQITIPR